MRSTRFGGKRGFADDDESLESEEEEECIDDEEERWRILADAAAFAAADESWDGMFETADRSPIGVRRHEARYAVEAVVTKVMVVLWHFSLRYLPYKI